MASFHDIALATKFVNISGYNQYKFDFFFLEIYIVSQVSVSRYTCVSVPGFDLGTSILESLGLHGSPKMESHGGNVESQTWGS